jgi:hypothetical protein
MPSPTQQELPASVCSADFAIASAKVANFVAAAEAVVGVDSTSTSLLLLASEQTVQPLIPEEEVLPDTVHIFHVYQYLIFLS